MNKKINTKYSIVLDEEIKPKNRNKNIHSILLPTLYIFILIIFSTAAYDYWIVLKMKRVENSGIILCFWSPWMNSLIITPVILLLGSIVSIYLSWKRLPYPEISKIDGLIVCFFNFSFFIIAIDSFLYYI